MSMGSFVFSIIFSWTQFILLDNRHLANIYIIYSFLILGLWIFAIIKREGVNLITIRLTKYKMLSDMLVTYAALWFYSEYQITFFLHWYFVLLYSIYNVLHVKSKFLSYFFRGILLLMAVTSNLIYELESYNTVLLWMITLFMYISHLILEFYFIRNLSRAESEKNKIIRSSLRGYKTMIAIAGFERDDFLHDLRNRINSLGFVPMYIKKGKIEKALELLDKTFKSISMAIENTGARQPKKLNIGHIVEQISIRLSINYKVDKSCFIPIMVSNNYFTHVIGNLIENAIEAMDRDRRKKPSDLLMEYYVFKNSFYVKDNAGGFDLNRINDGYSSKKKYTNSHGYFVKSLEEKGKLHNMPMKIEERFWSRRRIGTNFIFDIEKLKILA